MKGLRFLLAMWDGGGVVPPELGVARRLIARGHAVRVLADPVIEAEARAAGCDFSSWTTAPHRATRDRSADLIRDYEKVPMSKMIEKHMGEFLGGPAPRWAADTLAELRARPVDVFLADQMIPAVQIAAEKLGLPRAALSPNCWMLPTPGIPPFGPGFKPARGPFSRLLHAFVRSMTTRVFDRALPALNATRVSYGLPPVATTFEQILRVDATYVLASPAFDFTSPALPPSVRYVGPILDDPAWSQPWRSPWRADDARPLVLVGFSSQFQDHAAALQRVVDALAALPVRAVVTLGEALDPEEVKGTENVQVVKSAPHSELLKAAAAVVTHAGHGTTMKGLVAGVPLVCVPIGRDQKDNAVRVTERGAGVCVKPTASVASIRGAIEKVLGDPRYREGARRLGRAISEGEGCADLIAELEKLATLGGQAA